ncbi:MAG: hypothetical protein DHS20C06_10920 [Hyphobacterium sp.]|nr:MAG: hypothetical protein DHS20C06_10920 [Hyphobacterium sp.]
MRLFVVVLYSLFLTGNAYSQGLPRDVATAYRAYEAAVDAEDWTEAALQAELAWRGAESGDVDDATVTTLAANFGEVALIVGDNTGAAEAYERAVDIMGRRHEDVETRANYLRLAAQAQYLVEDYRAARNLSADAADAFENLPESEAIWVGIYQSQMIRAFAYMRGGNAIRGGRFARQALEALSHIGPVNNDETASLAFLAGLNSALSRQATEAAYYFTLTSYINDEIEAGEDASNIALAWARYMRGTMSADERAELLNRLQNSGYRPAECSIGDSGCYDSPEWVDSFGSDAAVVDAEPERRIPPQYPAEAAGAGLEGMALMRYTITAEGRATDIEAVYSVPHSVFADASEDVLRRWRFRPATVDGIPVERTDRYTQFEFALAN